MGCQPDSGVDGPLSDDGFSTANKWSGSMKIEDIVARITEGINEVFPESVGMEVNTQTLLDAIPDWDSMASVNLQMYLETAFGCSFPSELLSGETPIGDIVEHVQAEAHVRTD